MKFGYRNIASLFLAVLIGFTSVTMSLARGQMRDAAGSIVLCSSTGPIAIVVDADGQPIGPMPICPDCALGGLDAIELNIAYPATFGIETATTFDSEQIFWHSQHSVPNRARGPPSSF